MLKLFRYTCGLDDKFGAATDEQDAYDRRAEVDSTFDFVGVQIEEITVPGFEFAIYPEGTALNAVTEDKFDGMERDDLKVWLDERNIAYTANWGDKRLRETARSAVSQVVGTAFTPSEIAKVCHEVNRAYCRSIGDDSQLSWEDAPQWQKDSAINGVSFHMENETTPEQSHENWMKEKLENGWKYGDVKDSEKKEHPCIVPYNQLPVEQRTKDYLFKAVVESYK